MSDVLWELVILSNAIFAFFSSGLQLAHGNGMAAGWAALTGMWVVAMYYKIRTTSAAKADEQT